MALKRRTPIGGDKPDYDKLEDGEYEGRLIFVADLGLQEREYMGETKPPAQQISLGIEILGEPVTIDGQEVPRLMWTKAFNIFDTMNEKGNEFKFFRVFAPSAREGQVADWEAVLGEPCNVVVGTRKSKDREFDNIDDLTPIPAKYRDAVPPAELSPAIGDADDESNPATQALYGLAKYIYDKRLSEVESNF